MSIASEITRLMNLRNTIRSKLVSLGLVSSSADLDTCTDAISGITNRGNVSHTISSRDAVYTIPDGYHAGSGSVTISNTERQKIIASNIRSGVTILGIAGSYEGGGTVVEPELQNKTVTPTKSTQYITPDSGYDGLYQVTVNAIPAQYITTTDATAVASEILNGKTAYVNGSRIVGTMTRRSSVTDAQSVGLNGGSLAIRIPTGAYLQTASSGYPEILVNAGTANTNQVLQGVTFLSNTGSGLQTGEMINRGAWTSTVEPGERVTIPAGWHDGSGYVEAEDAPEAIEPTMYTCAAEVTTDSSSIIARKGLKITIPTTRIHDEIIIAFTLSDSYIFGGSFSNSPILSFSDGEVTGSPYGYESKLYLTSYNTTTGGSTEETFESGAVVLAQIPANSSSSIQRMYIHIPNDN